MIIDTRWKGGPLEIWEEGDGSAVGYLHGMICAPGQQPFLTALARCGYRVIAPSLPGYSRSSASAD